MDGYVTEKEAAALLGVSVDTLRRLRKTGTGPVSARFGRCVRYPRAAFTAWAEAQHVPAGA